MTSIPTWSRHQRRPEADIVRTASAIDGHGILMAPVAVLMSTRVVQMLRDIPLREAQKVADRYDFNCFPVVMPEGPLVGMLTKGDLLRAARAAATDGSVWDQPVTAWMAHGVLALRPQDSVVTAAELMIESRLRSLPVIDDADCVVGMVSRNDLIQALKPGEPQP
jgi:CBS domain-containing protein